MGRSSVTTRRHPIGPAPFGVPALAGSTPEPSHAVVLADAPSPEGACLPDGDSPEDAQDLTQGFFARLLERHAFRGRQPGAGRFRSFLLTALNHFLVNEWERQSARKRGGGQTGLSLDALEPEARYRMEPASLETPEFLYDRQWAATLLERVLDQLRTEAAATGRGELFQRLQPCLTGAEGSIPYAALGAQSGMTEAAVKMAVLRFRRRYGELLRAEIAHTVADPAEVEDEIRHLIAIAAR